MNLRGPPSPGTSSAPSVDGGGPSGGCPRSARVLVVDDNVDAAQCLALLLQLAGHTVRTAHSGPEALTTAAAFRPELIFLDLGLPGMSGYDVTRQLRASPELAGLVIVALTSWGRASDRQRTKEVGFDHHLTKPMEWAEVETLIASLP